MGEGDGIYYPPIPAIILFLKSRGIVIMELKTGQHIFVHQRIFSLLPRRINNSRWTCLTHVNRVFTYEIKNPDYVSVDEIGKSYYSDEGLFQLRLAEGENVIPYQDIKDYLKTHV